MRCRTILRASAPMLAGVALLAAGTGGVAVAQTQMPQPAPAQAPFQTPQAPPAQAPAQAPANAQAPAPANADCPDPETAGAPVVDEATVRQFEDVAPASDRVLPEGEPDTRDMPTTPAPESGTGQVGTSAPCPPAGEATGVAADSEVIESQPPGITELGGSPPNILHEESTLGLQQLIDRAHGGSTGVTRPEGGTRQVEGQSPALQDRSAPRQRIAPQ